MIEEPLNITLMKNEAQDINFSLIKAFYVFICFNSLVSHSLLILPCTLDGREKKLNIPIWHKITIIVWKLNIIV